MHCSVQDLADNFTTMRLESVTHLVTSRLSRCPFSRKAVRRLT